MVPLPNPGRMPQLADAADGFVPVTDTAENRDPSSNVQELRTFTASRSDSYANNLASVVARAFVKASDPLTQLFVREHDTPADRDLESAFTAYNHARITRKLADSSDTFIAESANFAAAATWEAKSIHSGPRTMALHLEVTARGSFLHELEALERQTLWPVVAAFDQAQGQTGGAFWHLCLTARDPARDNIAGAVRAVIVPIMKNLFTGEGIEVDGRIVGRTPILNNGTGARMRTPIWLEASSEHSRNVYQHYGFRDAGILHVAHAGGEKVPVWAMLYTGDNEIE